MKALPLIALCLLAAPFAPATAQGVGSSAKATGKPPAFQLKSPEVQAGGYVIFRLYAPKAGEVRLAADGMEATPGMTAAGLQQSLAGWPMAKSADGIWTIRFGPIHPGIYRYTFDVDGVTTVDPSNIAHSEQSYFVASTYEVPGAAFLEYRTDVPHGAVASVYYPSPLTNGLRRMHVYTPPGYELGGSTRYPVLYLLGGGNTDEAWASMGRAGAILDNLIASGRAVPMIVVMSAAFAAGGMESQTSDRTDRDLSNPDVVDQVLPYIDSHYRTLPDRRHRAVAGLSFGGLQALHLAFNTPMFANAGIFGSGWYPNLHAEQERSLAAYHKAGVPFDLFWMAAGTQDLARANSADTARLLTREGIAVQTYTNVGFHAFPGFREELSHFAPLLFHGPKHAR